LYTPEAHVLPETMVKHSRQLTATADGGFEIDAELAFKQVESVIDELYEKCGGHLGAAQLGAVSSFWHSLVGVDDAGNPTTKLYAWAETRPARFVEKLKNDLDESAIHNRTGCPFHSSYWPAKLLWLREHDAAAYQNTKKWLSFPDLMGARFFDDGSTGLSMASGTGLFDLRTQTWDPEMVGYLGLNKSSLPDLAADEEPKLSFNAKYQERWPDMAGSRWFPAVGDGAGNNIGAGCLTKSKAALMIGTSGAMRVVYEGDPPKDIPTGLWCYRVDSKRVVIGGALSDGGGLYRWLKDNLRISNDDDETDELIAKRAPDGHGLTFLPFLAGERSTGYNDFATGALIGLRSAHDSVDIVQAALESVAYRFCEIYKRLDDALELEEIVASGGALRASPVWTQIICDVIGRGMTLPETREASSRGVVLLAAEKAGLIDSIEEISDPEAAVFRCRPELKAAYEKGHQRHRDYYAKLVGQ
jgi:gluconokinase